MKLNINAKELLALYNVLHVMDLNEVTPDSADFDHDTLQLKQVYNRLRAILIAGVTNPGKIVDPVDSWLKHESVKIDELKRANDELRDTASDPNNFVSPLVDIMADDGDEVVGDLTYPKVRKGPPGNQQKQHRRRK